MSPGNACFFLKNNNSVEINGTWNESTGNSEPSHGQLDPLSDSYCRDNFLAISSSSFLALACSLCSVACFNLVHLLKENSWRFQKTNQSFLLVMSWFNFVCCCVQPSNWLFLRWGREGDWFTALAIKFSDAAIFSSM